jgi:hypothetical protein
MARKRRRSSIGKWKKKTKTRGKTRRMKSRSPVRKRKRRARTLRGKVASAYRTVVDTIKGTDRLRNKMELPATSETE